MIAVCVWRSELRVNKTRIMAVVAGSHPSTIPSTLRSLSRAQRAIHDPGRHGASHGH